MRKAVLGMVVSAVLACAATASATPIVVTVGDNDGYGLGIPDNGTAPWTNPPVDARSAAEAAAVNGAQITDVYSAIFPGFGPNGSSTADVILPFSGTLNSATLTIDMGDFQASSFGPILATINGSPLSLAFDDGFQATRVRSFVLTPAEIAAANLAGEVDLHLDHSGSGDFIAFDYFQLSADATTTVPEPTSLLLLGSGIVAALRRRATKS